MMVVKAVTRYESEDGKLFDDYNEAKSYNAQLKAMNGFKNAIMNADPSHSMGLLHINVVNSPAKVKSIRDACNKILDYHRNYGKLKKS